MCGRFSLTSPLADLRALFGFEARLDLFLSRALRGSAAAALTTATDRACRWVLSRSIDRQSMAHAA